ncbi:MAG: nucleotidyltransferase domain-containing protein [Methanophagales archaeon]|nr:nucleotidyltransferase domain-containing protein [Methanophagales archaeon]
MHKLCRIDIRRGGEIYKEIGDELRELAERLREKYGVRRIIVFGSYVRGDLNEGSDIDLVVVGDFKERFHKRIASILNLTDLPIEPLCYTEEEFREMIRKNNSFISEVLKEGENLLRTVSGKALELQSWEYVS